MIVKVHMKIISKYQDAENEIVISSVKNPDTYIAECGGEYYHIKWHDSDRDAYIIAKGIVSLGEYEVSQAVEDDCITTTWLCKGAKL